MQWRVEITRKAAKGLATLPDGIKARLSFLAKDLAENGPVRGNWKNYGKLGPNRHHCHIKTGRPTYVAVWEVVDNQIHVIEVQYAGTHENAPY